MPVRLELRRDANRMGPHFGPWIARKDLSKVQGPPDPMAVAQVINYRGEILAHALYSPQSEIVGRVVQWGLQVPDEHWLEQRIASAWQMRLNLGLGGSEDTSGYRVINSEGDGLPGLVADRYGSHIVVQLTTAPMVAREAAIVAALQRACEGIAPHLIVVRSQGAAKSEGFDPGVQHLGQPVETLHYRENGLRLAVSAPPAQQKTGGYHDQRDNRQRIADLAQQSRGPLLELGSHVAGFALHAAAQGVPSVGVDLSATVLEHAAQNSQINQVTGIEWVKADLFAPWHDSRLMGPFGCIVVDPPKMSSSRRDRDTALAALTRVVAQALPRLQTHGYLVLCSCSQPLGVAQLDEAVLAASLAQHRFVTRRAVFGPGLDHPVAPGHASGEYLRVVVYTAH